MDTPLWIREVVNAVVVFNTADAGTPDVFALGPSGAEAVAEPTLIEKIRYAADTINCDAGQIFFYVTPPSGSAKLIHVEEVAASGALVRPAGEIDINIPLAVGWKLGVAHNIEAIGGSPDIDINFFAEGGILR